MDDHSEFLKSLYDEFMVFYAAADYDKAADYFLALIQDTRPDPVAFLDYQKSSFKHFLRATVHPEHPLTFEAFQLLLRNFVAAADQGHLPDMRGSDN